MPEEAAELIEESTDYLPLLVTLGVVALVFLAVRLYFGRRERTLGAHNNFSRPIVTLILLVFSIVAVIISLPLDDSSTKDQLFGLFGLAMTVAVALSSTTFVSNAMAGFMIRAIGSFRSGDFVRVSDNFGRVSARGLFHTEIQTEDRDLTTLPNLYLVTNPVTVVRSSGTIISATISLGYDVHQATVEPLLLEAARDAGLEDPFVRVMALGDFSVSYRVAGLLKEVKHLVSKRSHLHINVLNTLQNAGIEILSPTAVMQRPLKDGQKIMPERKVEVEQTAVKEEMPEEKMFDKAEEAEQIEKLGFERSDLLKEKEELTRQLSELKEEKKSVAEKRIQIIEAKIAQLDSEREGLSHEEGKK